VSPHAHPPTVPVEKIVEVQYDKIVEKIISVPVQKIVERPVEVPVEKIIELGGFCALHTCWFQMEYQ